MSKRSVLSRRAVIAFPVRRILAKDLARADDDDWLDPKVSDPVDGHYVVWLRKPMRPTDDGPVDLSGPPFRAYMVNKRYTKILLMPEQFQLDKNDIPGTRLGDPTTQGGKRLRDKWLGEARQYLKWLDEAVPGCLQILNDAQKIDFSPGVNYNPDEGYFTVVDEMGRPMGYRANVLIMAPSQRKYVVGSFNMTIDRGPTYLDYRKVQGTGAIITIETESGTEYAPRQICGNDRSFAHEICHALQRVLGVMPWDSVQFREINVPASIAENRPIFEFVRKSETDVVSPVSRRDHNKLLEITDEGALAVEIFNEFTAHIDQELPDTSVEVKEILIDVMNKRQVQIWANIYTEETLYIAMVEKRGIHRYIPARVHYLDVLGNRYLTRTPLEAEKRWISVRDGRPLCD